jgi:hypothetical protein
MTAGLLWIDTAGVSHDLTDPNSYFWTQGAQGMFMPDMDLQEQGVPLLPGSIPRLTLAKTRDVLLPLVVKGVSASDFYNNLEALCSMFYSATAQEPGTLRRTTPNGHTRDLLCYYVSGASGDESVDHMGVAHMDMVIALHACMPFWQDSAFNIQTFSTGGLVAFFQNPFLPLHLSPSGLASAFTVTNSGDDVCYPQWTIQGPASSIVLTNTYTLPNGATITKTLALSNNGGLTLGGSDTLTIITDPANTQITKQDGSNQFSYLALTSSLWSLQKGINQCAVLMSGTSSATLVTLQYKQRYLTP